MQKEYSVAVAIPCYNESVTIGKVVTDFKHELPNARIVVFDNNSYDDSVQKAMVAGAEVVREKKQGKGYVVRNMFDVLKEDFIVMVDGDDTYLASDVHTLLETAQKTGAELVVGNRLKKKGRGMNVMHTFGNLMIKTCLNVFFQTKYQDVLSGYRVISREYYKNVPILSCGFEIETEMTLQAIERGYLVREVSIEYKNRPTGSFSKIKDFSDGYRILFTIISLLRDYRPMTFFSSIGGILIAFGMLAGLRVVIEYIQTGLVLYLPTAVLSIALIILGCSSILSGLTVSTINRRTKELEILLKRHEDKENSRM